MNVCVKIIIGRYFKLSAIQNKIVNNNQFLVYL